MNPFAAAFSATKFVFDMTNKDQDKLLHEVQKGEGCPHIILVQSTDLGLDAVATLLTTSSHSSLDGHIIVGNKGGVAWNLGKDDMLVFYHKEATFKPLHFKTIFIRNKNGKTTSLSSAFEYDRMVDRPKDGYGCSECRKIAEARK